MPHKDPEASARNVALQGLRVGSRQAIRAIQRETQEVRKRRREGKGQEEKAEDCLGHVTATSPH